MISRQELERIRNYLGHNDFHHEVAGYTAIRMRADGSCTFLDPETTRCTIYPVRPYDCNAFPFDYISTATGEWRWIVWDCGFSRALSEAQIEEHLCHLEAKFGEVLLELRGYGEVDLPENQIYKEGLAPATSGDASRPSPFRVLRAVRIPSQAEPAPESR